MRTLRNTFVVAVAVAAMAGCQGKEHAPAAPPAAEAPPAATAPMAAAAVPAAPAPAPQAAEAQPAEEPAAYSPTAEPAETPAPAAAPAPAVVPLPKTEPKETIVDSEPPDLVYEEQPKAPGAGYVWTPGYWHWSASKWMWNHGTWRTRPTGLNFVPAHYEVVNGRVVYVQPHWAAKVIVPSFGGRILVARKPVRPATWRPGVRYVVKPMIGFRVGSRPVTIYRQAGPVTRTIVVPPRPVRPVGAHPGMPGAHPGMPGAHPGMPGMPGAHPGMPGAHPVAPGAHPVAPGAHPVMPGAHPGMPGAHPGMPVKVMPPHKGPPPAPGTRP